MTLEIKLDGEVVFSQSEGENCMFPFDESERDTVQKALVAALATLSGLMPQSYILSKEGGLDRHCSKIEQCQGDPKGADVVHLSELRHNQSDTKER